MHLKKDDQGKNLQKMLALAVVVMSTTSLSVSMTALYNSMGQVSGIDYQQMVKIGENTLQHSTQVLDNLIFSKAEAFTPVVGGGSGVDSTDGETIAAGDLQNVDVGGQADNTTINGGTQNINDGGQADNTTINDGYQDVFSGGQATNTTINNVGAIQYVHLGGLATDTIINNGIQEVKGQAINTVINNNGIQSITEDGKTTGTVINNNGHQSIYDNGQAMGTIINDNGTQAIYVDGQAIGTVINDNGHQRIVANGQATNTTINDNGEQRIAANGQATNTTINDNGQQLILDNGQATNTTINDNGQQYIYANATGTIINAGGQQIIRSGGLATDTTINQGGTSLVDAGGMFSGRTINNGLLDLGDYDQASGLNLSGTIGTVNIMPSAHTTFNHNVTINNLEGSQTFVISADLANNKADMITITNSAVGKHYVQIGKENTPGNNLLNISADNRAQVVATPGSAAIFEGALSAIDGVVIMPNIMQDGDDWYLVGYTKGGKSPLADTAFASGNMVYTALLNSSSEIMIQRMGDIQADIQSAGVWSKIGGGQKSISGAQMSHHGIQIGYDKVRPRTDGHTLTGVLVEHFNSSNSYQNANGKLRSTQLGLYHIWQGQSGHYYDLVLKTGILHNEFGTYDQERISGGYNTWSTNISAEYGYKKQLSKGYYVMPLAKLSLGRINGADYMTSGDTAIKQAGITSLTAKLGVNVGRKVKNTSWYINTAVIREFTATNKVSTGLGEFQSVLEQNLKSTYFELVLGGDVKIGKQGSLYMDINKTFGGKVQNKWQLQAGYRFSF